MRCQAGIHRIRWKSVSVRRKNLLTNFRSQFSNEGKEVGGKFLHFCHTSYPRLLLRFKVVAYRKKFYYTSYC